MTALGFIETKGLLTAIEGADAMLKAADVRLLEKNLASGGLVTITIAGEVSAVQASVDAAVAAIQRINSSALVSKHVIARPDEGLAHIIATKFTKGVAQATHSVAKETVRLEKNHTNFAPPAESNLLSDTPAAKAALAPKKQEASDPDISQLKKMSVNRLRQIAQTIKGFSIPQGKIASADRNILIEAIVNAYRQREE